MKLKILLIFFLIKFEYAYTVDNNIDQEKIFKNLRCLICQGQSISDSNSDFAITIKLVVKDLILKGKSEEEIYSFMADKYGEWIVYKPIFNKNNSVLWILPYATLLGGGAIIFFMLNRKRKKI
tara:strand:- start:29 stop:397 length:369 start_codon:yes stop_codon:yes gene_type:complete